jgi:hypothetical protein
VAENDAGRDLWDSLLEGFTLPGHWYADPQIFATEKEKIFGFWASTPKRCCGSSA